MPALLALAGIGIVGPRDGFDNGKRDAAVERQSVVALARDYLGRMGAFDRAVNISVERQTARRPGAVDRPLWAVQCEDLGGRSIAYMVIDAATDCLVVASCRIRPSAHPRGPAMNRGDAVAVAARAVRRCTEVRHAERLRVVEQPELSEGVWAVELRSRSQITSVCVDGRTAEVFSLSTRQSPRPLSWRTARLQPRPCAAQSTVSKSRPGGERVNRAPPGRIM